MWQRLFNHIRLRVKKELRRARDKTGKHPLPEKAIPEDAKVPPGGLALVSQLNGKLYRYAGDRLFVPVWAVADADSVWFLCPKCYVANRGNVGTHSIRIDLRGRGVPDDICMRNKRGECVRWAFEGDESENLTLSPSIQLEGGCNWHGYVRSGMATDA